MRIECPICGDTTATCNWDSDSDGAAYTWITWSHYCSHCGYSVKRQVQSSYNYEDVENCPIPGHREARQDINPSRDGSYVNYWLNANINVDSGLATKIKELQERLSKLEDFEKQALKQGGVFISYSHADCDIVDEIVQRFDRDGIFYWRDEKELLIGQVIDKAVSEGIQKNWLFLIILTPASVASKWVEREFDEASYEEIEGRKMVLPVVAKGLRMENLPPRIRRKLCVNFSIDFDSSYNKLKNSIKEYLKNYERSKNKNEITIVAPNTLKQG
jgi:hypothetical protein